MLFSEWYNKQCIHKNWQSYTQINRGTICAKELPFRVQPFRGVNCGLIPILDCPVPTDKTTGALSRYGWILHRLVGRQTL